MKKFSLMFSVIILFTLVFIACYKKIEYDGKFAAEYNADFDRVIKCPEFIEISQFIIYRGRQAIVIRLSQL